MAIALSAARAPRCCKRRRCTAGFTLLEILVAMVVLALIVTTAFGALRVGERSWEAGLEQTNKTEQLRMTADLLRRQFAQLLPLSWTEDGEQHIAFRGSAELVQFVAPAPQQHGATGLFEFTVSVERYESGARLAMYYRVIDPDHKGLLPPREGRRVVLAEKLQGAEISYFGSASADQPPAWHRQWSNEAEDFPQLVQFAMESADQRQQWPPLVVPTGSGPAR